MTADSTDYVNLDEATCMRCGQSMFPHHMTTRVCPNAPDGGGCEPPHPYDAWLPSVTVRQGSSLHEATCERSDPSVWLPPDMPCGCDRR